MAHDTLEHERHREIPRQAGTTPALAGAVEGTLVDFLTAQIAQLDAVDPALGGFARTARDLVMAGGKRLRPTFAYWGWQGATAGHEPLEPVLPALAALELMHTFALVHDDVMDASATRRGKPTAHRVFASRHAHGGGQGDPERFGSAAAILVGDLCLVWADQLLAQARLTAGTLFSVRALYDRMRIEAVAGQYLDVLGETEPGSWTLERALLVARLKTASYTVQRPLEFGLALAGGASSSPGAALSPTGAAHSPTGTVLSSPGAALAGTPLAGTSQAAVAAAYRKYGLAVGEAFQLCDDLLGVFGDPAVTGKPAGDDLRAGKPTALLMLAHRLATPAQRVELEAVLSDPAQLSRGPGLARASSVLGLAGNSTGPGLAGTPTSPGLAGGSTGPGLASGSTGPGVARGSIGPGLAGDSTDPAGAVNPADGSGGLTDSDVARLTRVVAATGAPEQIEAMIADRVAEAVAALDKAPLRQDARAALVELAVRATHRPA